MTSDNESGTGDIVSERETQFVPRSDDEQVLWSVQEITAERGKKYKVKWAGTNPATGKPWAQSWVAKHDCTDDLVVDWKAKKKRLADKKKRGGPTSTTSRASGSSKRAASSTSGKKTRPSTSEATSSRLDSVQEYVSPPPKRSTTKRKRQSETPAMTSSGTGQADEQSEPPRPRKKQKISLETLLPPISSDEDEDALLGLDVSAKVTLQSKAPSKITAASLDISDKDDSLLAEAKAKGKSVHRSDGTRLHDSKMKTKSGSQPKEPVADAVPANSSEDEEPRRLESKKTSSSKRESPSDRNDDPSEKEVESVTTPIKIGPPRGIRRPQVFSKPGRSRTQSREDDSADEHVPTTKFKDLPGHEVSGFRKPLLSRQATVDGSTSALPPPHISISPTVQSGQLSTPNLSPGARARLELFDRMMADAPQPDAAPSPADMSEPILDDTHFNNDAFDTHDTFEVFDPPRPPSPPPLKSKHSNLGTPNEPIVPETESSGNSRSQSQSLSRLPPSPQPPPVRGSPRKPMDFPTIAVIAASAPSTSPSPSDLFPSPPKFSSPANCPPKRSTVEPVPQISPNTFRSTINARSHVTDSEAPPSSIESFTSPKRVDKGKQRAIEGDFKAVMSEAEGIGERQKRPTQKKITDSGLRKRGKELFDLVQLVRESERRKRGRPKRLKPVNDILNQMVPLPPKESLPPIANGAESTLEMQWEELIDLSGGANSTILDTAVHGGRKTQSEEEKERLRIELRQEEEENTQEAMCVYPPPPAKELRIMNGGNAQMPPPRSPEHSPLGGRIEDVDRVEQRSADLHQASVIVQPSQGQRHEDTDIEPLPANQPTSSPARPIPEKLTDSPKRRLGEALSLLNVKSEEIQRLERELADERKNLQSLKVELAEMQQSSEPTGPVLAVWEAERAQWTQERSKWENDFAVWETQRKEWCDDKANLSARVAELVDAAARAAEVSVKLSELEAERAAWIKERDALLADTIRQSDELAVLTSERATWTKERDTLLIDIAQRSDELAVLATERVTWTKERDALLIDMAQRSDELAALTKARAEHDQSRLEWEAERASWAEEKVGWETERAALQDKQETLSRSVDELTALLGSLTPAKTSAEKDRDFFREKYMQASGFVSSVREENLELEKRVTIAEGQAQEGVAAIKALYEGRIKTLQADVGRWKGLTELLQEKDKRTNDELRLHAAQVPELGDRCGRLTAENKSLEADVRKLSATQQRNVVQQNKLYYEILMLKKERASLRSKLTKLAQMADSRTQETSHSMPVLPIPEDPESLDPNDMEMLPDPTPQSSVISVDEPALFPCMWRPQWRDQCPHIFDTKEDLERHMQEHLRDLSQE